MPTSVVWNLFHTFDSTRFVWNEFHTTFFDKSCDLV